MVAPPDDRSLLIYEPETTAFESERPMNVLWGRIIVLAVVLLLVFLLGRATGGDSGRVEELQSLLASREAEIDQLEAQNRELANSGTGGTTDNGTTGDGTTGDGTTGDGTTGGTTTGGGAPTPSPTPTATATAGSTQAQTYKVVSGDTLSRISSRFYGSTAFVKCIQTANQLTDSNIRTGQDLTIPPKPPEPCT